MKVYEFAKEIGMETIALMDKIKEWKLPVKSHMAGLTDEQIDEIKAKLAESQASKKTTKKKTVTKKKTAAKKKTVAKKTAKKTAAKKVAKKTVKKTVVKKASGTTTTTAAKKTAKKTAGKKKTVIRRKAAHSPEAIEKAQAEAAEAATKEAAATAEGAEAAPETKKRGNIVGRIDLDKIKAPAGASGGAKPARTEGNRNIRTGFVAATSINDVMDRPEDREARDKKFSDKEAERKKKAAGKVEEKPQSFSASEFRKREVIFQPKKKRVMVGETKKTQITQPKAHKRIVKMDGEISVSELAQQMNIKAPQLIKKLIASGEMANMNTRLDFDTVSIIAPEFGFEVQNTSVSEEEILETIAFGNLEADLVPRSPVVTVMGHVDHGKTTLLDAIRNADVVSGEAGGITQHIGAYNVTLEDGKVATFIDTPGHAAFTAMRARGAHVTDIAIIVVAADDGMMPQTEEAISHAQAAEVPIIVAVNKMDTQGANPDKIKQQLAEKNLVPEDWGGDTMFVPVSALKKEGITELIENIHLVAEVLELKANPERSATGIVVESKMEKGKGNVATLLVQDGTIKVGDYFVAGFVTGRVRRMTNDRGEMVKLAGPGTPVEITGLDNTPSAGDKFDVCKSEDEAQKVAEVRKKEIEAEEVPSSKMSLDQIFAKVKAGDVKELPIVLKTDVAGTAEAIKGVFDKLGTDEVKVKVIHNAVGGISENDVLLAHTSGGIVIGFNVRPDTSAQRLAKEKTVEIKTYSVIYNLSDDIKQAMAGLLSPDVVEEAQGSAEVRETFSVPKMGVIAGCMVTDGKIQRSSNVRLLRDGRIVYEGKLGSLKRFKDDAKEVQSGYECGIGIENYNDIKAGDVIEAYITKEVAREL